MLTEKQYGQIREELDFCEKPLYFFDDDPDGLTAFLLLYRYKQEGKGIPVKTSPKLSAQFLTKVQEYAPDKIFVVDTPIIQQEFIDGVKVPIIWVDHHGPAEEIEGVKYFNPRVSQPDQNLPTSYICYNVVKQDMWVAAIGCIGDWFFPPFAEELRKKYPTLLPENLTKPEDVLFNSKLGYLVKVVSNILKGKTTEVMKCVKIMTRIKDPEEILSQTTSAGKYLFKRSQEIEKDYQMLLKDAIIHAEEDIDYIIFKYKHDKFSFTKELANELLYKYPSKKLIIGREKGDEIKCSLRGSHLNLKPIVEVALSGVEGYGGGHEHACGACVNVNDFDKFVAQFKNAINKL